MIKNQIQRVLMQLIWRTKQVETLIRYKISKEVERPVWRFYQQIFDHLLDEINNQ
jgi:hypothetical protein